MSLQHEERMKRLDQIGRGTWVDELVNARQAAVDDSLASGRVYEEAVLTLTTIPCEPTGIPSWISKSEAKVLAVDHGTTEIRMPLADHFLPTMGGTLRMRRLPVDGDQTIIECYADRMVLPPHYHQKEVETIQMLSGEIVDAVSGKKNHGGDFLRYQPHKHHAPCALDAHYILTFTPALPILNG